MSKTADQKRQELEQIIRVDHAGEYGARRIYEGQLAVLKGTELEPIIKEMYEQEAEHLDEFDRLIAEHKVRPTLLRPLWSVAGFGLGYVSAKLGKKAAMACTVAVEDTIEKHYQSQYESLDSKEQPQLKRTIKKFRDEEIEHKNTALDHDAEDMKGYESFSKLIKFGSKVAIAISKKV